MKKLSTKQVTIFGVLAGLYVILSLFSIGTNDFNVSLKSIATLMSGLFLGPVGGLCVGAVGEFISQLLGPYGVDITTPIWLIPYFSAGIVAGLVAKNKQFDLDNKAIIKAIVFSEITLTVLVTAVNGISAIVQGWGTWFTILAAIPSRLLIMVIRVVLYCVICPILYKNVKKGLGDLK